MTLEQLFQAVKKMYQDEENRDKEVQIWFWSMERQVGACSFDKLGAITDAGNYWETREQTSTHPVIKVDEI